VSKRIAVALFGPEGRGSFNESGLQGAMRARAIGHQLDVHWITPPDPAGRAQELRRLCQQGMDLLVAHGGQGDLPVAAVCQDFPGTAFAITQGSFLAPNTACFEVLQEQSAFLAGVLAGLASTTRVVAHLSGEKVRPGLKGRAAFAHGVRASAPDCRFVTSFCGHQHVPDLAYKTAMALHSEGADLVFAMIDGGREGVSRACRETNLRQIGNVLDWVERDPKVFVASAIADSGYGVLQAIEAFASGRMVMGKKLIYGLESADSVRLLMSESMAQAHGATIESWRQKLLAGQVVPSEDYDGPELSVAS
jgi:basic membrane protein A